MDLYYFIKKSLKFEKKVTIPKKVLMASNFQDIVGDFINKNPTPNDASKIDSNNKIG